MRLVFEASVASTVATTGRQGTSEQSEGRGRAKPDEDHSPWRKVMFSLGPVMSSMFISFHVPVVSGFQATVHSEASLNTEPGLGMIGSGSARTEAAPKRTEATTTDESMVSKRPIEY